MDFDVALQSYFNLLNQNGHLVDSFLLCMMRVMGFVHTAPIFGRKDLPSVFKTNIGILLTIALFNLIPKPEAQPSYWGEGDLLGFMVHIIINVTIGVVLGSIADLLKQAIDSAGGVATNQMGLSSAMTMDPSSRQQVMLLQNLYSWIGTMIFIGIGGVYWLIDAILRSFTMFPMYTLNPAFSEKINPDYIISLSADVMTVAVELVSPIILATMTVDIMLGVVNKTAPQIPVFQLSMGLKPSVGVIILIITLPILINAMGNHLEDFKFFF